MGNTSANRGAEQTNEDSGEEQLGFGNEVEPLVLQNQEPCVSDTSISHSQPKEGSECAVCMDEITDDARNYVEYQAIANGPWLPAGFCVDCIELLLQTQFHRYVDLLAKTTCKAEQARLLETGPPINVRDKNGMPCPNDGEVHSLWYARDEEIHSAKLVGSLVGKEREEWWEQQKKFKIPDDAEDDE